MHTKRAKNIRSEGYYLSGGVLALEAPEQFATYNVQAQWQPIDLAASEQSQA